VIHQVHLPDVTRRRLTDVVRLQVRLLHYAALTATPDATSCAHYLDQSIRFRGRGTQIARWLWRAPKRHRALETFAQGPAAEKWQWYQRVSREALAFLHNRSDSPSPHRDKNAIPWQKAGAIFLRNFYDDLCEPSGLPSYLFAQHGAIPFRRQDFLARFEQANRGLYVCAVCDETLYRTVVDGDVYSEIEHYLPKSRYPHLACHPFNLLPICSSCNRLKGSVDPLQGRTGNRHDLEDILLPYREPGLGSRTYLHVQLGRTPDTTQLSQLRPRPAIDLHQRIATFAGVYKVPKRWQGQIKTIEDTLFRRIRHALQLGWHASRGGTMPQILLAVLDQLLEVLHEAQGQEPFAFAMTWWLATLINQEVEPATRNPAHPMPQLSILLQALSIDTSVQSGTGLPTSSAQFGTARSLRGLLQ